MIPFSPAGIAAAPAEVREWDFSAMADRAVDVRFRVNIRSRVSGPSDPGLTQLRH